MSVYRYTGTVPGTGTRDTDNVATSSMLGSNAQTAEIFGRIILYDSRITQLHSIPVCNTRYENYGASAWYLVPGARYKRDSWYPFLVGGSRPSHQSWRLCMRSSIDCLVAADDLVADPCVN